MKVKLRKRPVRNGKRIYYTFEWGKRPGERKASGIWTYSEPKDMIQENQNKEALIVLEEKRSQLLLLLHFIETSNIPLPKFKENFFD